MDPSGKCFLCKQEDLSLFSRTHSKEKVGCGGVLEILHQGGRDWALLKLTDLLGEFQG